MRNTWITKVRHALSYNYCIKIYNSHNECILIQDITGGDLELIEEILETSAPDVYLMCELLKSKIYSGKNEKYSIYKFPIRFVYAIFKVYLSEIISKEYIDKITWLKAVYSMQKNSFRDLDILEKTPMNKFLVMLDIHKEAVENANSKP